MKTASKTAVVRNIATASWGDFAEAEPEMAKVLTSSLDWIPITYLATVRKDGSPRVHPVCPIIGKGRMFVAVNQSSPKRFDLKNDGRYAMHALPGKRDDEFYMVGRVRMVKDAATRALVVKSAGHTVHDSDWLFEFEIERVMTAYWENMGKPDTYAVRKFWHAT
jgi:hypothetical protein